MRAAYARAYTQLTRQHWWWRARRRIVLNEIDRLGSGWSRILDIGCGGGALFDDLIRRGRHVEGIEPDAALIEPGASSAGRIHVRPFDETFEPDSPFDLVLMLDVLEHMDRRIPALAHTRRILRTGGSVLITVPAGPRLWTSHDELNEHRLRYTPDALRSEVTAAGLEVLRMRYLFHWAVPGKLAQRLAETMRRPDPSPPKIAPRPVNALLEIISLLDYRVGEVFSLPFGTSLLLAARHRQ